MQVNILNQLLLWFAINIGDPVVRRQHNLLARRVNELERQLAEIHDLYLLRQAAMVERGTAIRLLHEQLQQLLCTNSAQQARIRELMQLATIDPLTGLSNRRGLHEMFEHEFGLLSREKTSSWVALIGLDIDHFKRINDTYGHAAGDAVLSQVATLLRSNRRPSDIVARTGGEEMVVVLPQATAEAAFKEAEEVRNLIAGASFVIPTGVIRVTISCGVAAVIVDANDQTRPEVALDQLSGLADKALYRAKQSGRNRTVQSDEIVGS